MNAGPFRDLEALDRVRLVGELAQGACDHGAKQEREWQGPRDEGERKGEQGLPLGQNLREELVQRSDFRQADVGGARRFDPMEACEVGPSLVVEEQLLRTTVLPPCLDRGRETAPPDACGGTG